jgi:hypothetical protein
MGLGGFWHFVLFLWWVLWSAVEAVIGFSRVMRNPVAASPSMVVVFISFARGGRPEAGLSDREIHHLVPVVSRGDIVASENRAV